MLIICILFFLDALDLRIFKKHPAKSASAIALTVLVIVFGFLYLAFQDEILPNDYIELHQHYAEVQTDQEINRLLAMAKQDKIITQLENTVIHQRYQQIMDHKYATDKAKQLEQAKAALLN